MKNKLVGLLVLMLLQAARSWGDPVPGSIDVQWNEGAEDCAKATMAPIQVHQYEPQTYILRESFCSDFEAPLLYLLIGDDEALLVDTGATEDSAQMPLVKTVMDLLPAKGDAKIPLLVLHSHGHGDHRAAEHRGQRDPHPDPFSPRPSFMASTMVRAVAQRMVISPVWVQAAAP